MFQPMVFTNTSSHFCINNLRLSWLGWLAGHPELCTDESEIVLLDLKIFKLCLATR